MLWPNTRRPPARSIAVGLPDNSGRAAVAGAIQPAIPTPRRCSPRGTILATSHRMPAKQGPRRRAPPDRDAGVLVPVRADLERHELGIRRRLLQPICSAAAALANRALTTGRRAPTEGPAGKRQDLGVEHGARYWFPRKVARSVRKGQARRHRSHGEALVPAPIASPIELSLRCREMHPAAPRRAR